MLLVELQGDQSREVIRVLVECCLQESSYNPYYGHLAARLTAVSKSHAVGGVTTDAAQQTACLHSMQCCDQQASRRSQDAADQTAVSCVDTAPAHTPSTHSQHTHTHYQCCCTISAMA